MKQKLLSLVIAGISAASLSGVAAAEGPSVYGKINVSLQNNDFENSAGDTDKDNWTLNNNASRIGVKGSYGLTDSLQAIYKLEYEIFVDEAKSGDAGSNFKQRNTYVGLQGNLGTVIAGRHDTPVKLIQGKIDRFNDLELGDIKNVIEGENRVDNVVMYTTPKLADMISVSAAFVQGEEDGVSPGEDEDGLGDGTSLSVTWEMGDLILALGVDSEIDSRDLTRFVAEYKLGDFKIGALLQQAELADGGAVEADEDGLILSGEWAVAENTALKLQYGVGTVEDQNNDETEKTQLALGLDYKLNKNAKVFAYYASVETEDELLGVSLPDSEDTTFAIGAEVKF